MRRVKRLAGFFLLIAMLPGGTERAQAEESLGNQIKKIFAPTPTPPPLRKHHKSSTAPKKKEEGDAPKLSTTPEKSEPLEPAPSKKRQKSSPTPDSSANASLDKKREPRPSPPPASMDSPKLSSSPTPIPGGSERVSSPSSPSPSVKKKGAPATIEASEISGYEDDPASVRRIIDTALELTTRNLDYTYSSADPANGGMDCSGFIFYVLTQNGLHDVPRDASEQYVWLRKAGNFRAVNSRHEDTFELDELVPGDLLFWTGTYRVERDPPVTHTMIYLGREKGTNQRIMAGASDGRTYKGEARFGVSIFDFKIPRPGKTEEARESPSFIGYGHIPGL